MDFGFGGIDAARLDLFEGVREQIIGICWWPVDEGVPVRIVGTAATA
jgi:hypothetical protein